MRDRVRGCSFRVGVDCVRGVRYVCEVCVLGVRGWERRVGLEVEVCCERTRVGRVMRLLASVTPHVHWGEGMPWRWITLEMSACRSSLATPPAPSHHPQGK